MHGRAAGRQRIGGHAAALGVAGKGQVQALESAIAEPAQDVIALVEVAVAVALAEQQPAARVAAGLTLGEVRAQAGDAGAVADQHHRRGGRRAVEAGVGADAQVDVAAGLHVVAQPAAADAGRAVGAQHAPQQQAQAAFAGDGGDRILARGQGLQPVGHGLRGQAAYRVGVRELRAREPRAERVRDPVDANRRSGVEARFSQQRGHRGGRLLRSDFGDVARAPAGGSVRRQHSQFEYRRALAARVDFAAPAQGPGLVGHRCPVGQGGGVGGNAQVVLPVAQRRRIAIVDFDQVEQGARAGLAQPLVERVPEGAVVAVAAVAERQHGVAQPGQADVVAHAGADEAGGGVGRIALAGGARDQQQLPRGRQGLSVQRCDTAGAHREAG